MVIITRWAKKGFFLEVLTDDKSYIRIKKSPTDAIKALDRYHLLSSSDKDTIIRAYGR